MGVVVAEDDVGIGGGGLVVELAEHGGVGPIVGVGMDGVEAGGVLNTVLACRGNTAVVFVKDFYTGVLTGVEVADGAAVVGAAVVDEDEFEVCIGLSQEAVDATVQVALGFVDGDDDADAGGAHGG